ncbi:hypothetical protein Gasu2_55820 [Galdieria sulphuraria]|nr:hypothetical protein Gasu2_55820 [Galdieria sulphuraria]
MRVGFASTKISLVWFAFNCFILVVIFSSRRKITCVNEETNVIHEASFPKYTFQPLLTEDGVSTDTQSITRLSLKDYVLSISNSNPPYYFVAFKARIDSIVSASMLSSGGYFDRFVHHIFDWHHQNRNNRLSTVDNMHSSKSRVGHCLCLDTGTNFGSFGLYAASKNCEVFGFEVQSSVFLGVAMAVRINSFGDRFHLMRRAVSNISGARVQVGFVSDKNVGGTSVSYDVEAVGSENVSTIRIDEVIPYPTSITFLKLDVEGSEWRAMLGMQSFFQHQLVDGVVVEVRNDDASNNVIRHLYEWGYVCMNVNSITYPLNLSAEIQSFPFLTTVDNALKETNGLNNSFYFKTL